MSKDPACLFYIDTWLTATAEMDADCKGWYLNLILHQYDKKSLPNDVEKLAVLANVKFSEYERFKQVFEQVLKQKFELNENYRLENSFAKQILQSRELFVNKRSDSGKISYSLKWLKTKNSKLYKDDKFICYFKSNYNFNDIDLKNEQMIKQMFEHLFELYINTNTNKYINKSKFIIPTFIEILEYSKIRKREDLAKKFFDYYDVGDWKDKNGDKVRNWKQKFITWENKSKKEEVTIGRNQLN